jgi:hypothetical protein
MQPPPTTGGRIRVVLLHHYIHAYKIIYFFSTLNNKNTHLIILNLNMCIHVLLIYIQSECLTLYIINKNYQWILTFGLLKYMVSSKLLGLFSYTCMLQKKFFNLYFIYLYLCYSYIFCFHFKDWRKRWIIHIASSVMLQNAKNVMSKLNIFF